MSVCAADTSLQINSVSVTYVYSVSLKWLLSNTYNNFASFCMCFCCFGLLDALPYHLVQSLHLIQVTSTVQLIHFTHLLDKCLILCMQLWDLHNRSANWNLQLTHMTFDMLACKLYINAWCHSVIFPIYISTFARFIASFMFNRDKFTNQLKPIEW